MKWLRKKKYFFSISIFSQVECLEGRSVMCPAMMYSCNIKKSSIYMWAHILYILPLSFINIRPKRQQWLVNFVNGANARPIHKVYFDHNSCFSCPTWVIATSHAQTMPVLERDEVFFEKKSKTPYSAHRSASEISLGEFLFGLILFPEQMPSAHELWNLFVSRPKWCFPKVRKS